MTRQKQTVRLSGSMSDMPLIVFDGACGLCHAWVRFVLRHDKRGVFKFTSMQSDKGQAILRQYRSPTDCLATMLYIENGLVWDKSRAFLKIVGQLPMPVRLLLCFSIIPRPLRDLVYDQIANNRYRLFGQRDICELMDTKNRQRFL